MSAKTTTIVSWVLALMVAGALTVLGWLPKFTGVPEAEALFNVVASSPMVPIDGDTLRVIVGVTELAVVVLVLVPAVRVLGGLLGAGAMLGAIMSHFVTPLGVGGNLLIDGEPQVFGDYTVGATNPVLFPVAVLVLLLSLALVFVYRDRLLPARDRAATDRSQASQLRDNQPATGRAEADQIKDDQPANGQPATGV